MLWQYRHHWGCLLHLLFICQCLLVPWCFFKWHFVANKWIYGYFCYFVNVFRYYLKHKIWVNIYTVDAKWLYSLYWCMNVTSITTNRCHEFAHMTSPVWHMVRILHSLFFIARYFVPLILFHFLVLQFFVVCMPLLTGCLVSRHTTLLIQYLSTYWRCWGMKANINILASHFVKKWEELNI